MTRTVVVTGAGGFIGAATVRRLAEQPDTRVIAVGRSRPRRPMAPVVRWIETTLEALTPAAWEHAEGTAVDAVIHLAAFTPKTAAERDRAPEIINANIVGLQTLLDSFPRPPRRVVFASTLDVYSRRAFDTVVDESSPTGPVGLYGLSKLFGENMVEAYARASGAECLTLRVGHVYGPGEERYAKLVPEAIRTLLAGKAPRIAGDGSDRRDLLYVDDAAEALARSCLVDLNGVRIVNLARGESYSIRDVIAILAELIGYHGPIDHAPRSPDAYSTSFDTSLMARVLGAWTFVPLAEGLTREIAHVMATTV